jgi:DNA repair protein RadA
VLNKSTSTDGYYSIEEYCSYSTAAAFNTNRIKTIERISTGSNNLDKILLGGIETGAVTEFYGESTSGKSQLCHTLCSIVPQKKSHGGIVGRSIYVDTENSFRPERLVEIALARGFDPSSILQNTVLYQPVNTSQQEWIIEHDIHKILKNKEDSHVKEDRKFKLLLIDSPITHYKSEYTKLGGLPIRQKKLFKFMSNLRYLSQTYRIAVVITNQVTTIPDSQIADPDRPTGGNVMAYTATYAIHLRTTTTTRWRTARITKSAYHRSKVAKFCISEKGIEAYED